MTFTTITPNTFIISKRMKERMLEDLYGEKPPAKRALEKVKHKPAPWKGEVWKKK